MDQRDYRNEYLAAGKKRTSRQDERVATRASDGQPEPTQLLAVLADAEKDTDTRLDALDRLESLSFAVETFRAFLNDYISTLRDLATGPRSRLRTRVLEVLALRHDEYAQRLLRDGLEGRTKPLVTERQAIRMLGYDPHALPRDVLVEFVDSSDTVVRREALRQLSADGTSVDILRKVAKDPEEDAEARRIGLVALQSLDPPGFDALARQVAVDDNAHDDLRAASLTALAGNTRTGHAKVAPALDRAVRKVRDESKSPKLTRAAADFLDAARSRDG